MGVLINFIEFALPKNKENLEDLLYKNPSWNIKKIFSYSFNFFIYGASS
jgi:hypothetical protein